MTMAPKRGLINLQNLSKEELITFISDNCNTFAFTKTDSNKSSNKNVRVFDPLAYSSRQVALKVAYFGLKYKGFASQVGLLNIFNENVQSNAADTVEDHIFRAIIRTKLLLDPKSCNYSRCGRTDSGVSSTGQVIALRLRTSNKKTSEAQGDGGDQIDYVGVLNKQLPEEIRILDWAFVNENFSARFSCSSRLYHYYFSKNHYDYRSRTVTSLDVEKMRSAAALLVGVHDFRNFCKRDPSKPNQTFIREIFKCEIEEVPNTSGFYKFICQGSAFLYHQIRCIMSVLFMIGSEEEPDELITEMFSRIKSREPISPGPLIHYDIASEIPLVLFDCLFQSSDENNQVCWRNKSSGTCTLIDHFHKLWEAKQSESLIIEGILKRSLCFNTRKRDETKISGKLLKQLKEISE